MRTFMILAGVGAVVVAVKPLIGHAERGPAAQPQQQEDFQWHGKIAAGKTLEIRGVNGAIRAERATGSEVEVSAVKSGRRSDPSDVEIQVVPHDGNVTICAVYPSNRDRQNECLPGGGHNSTHNNDVKVEWTVKLPAGVAFDGNTVNGDVSVENLAGDVRASTVNGDVSVSTSAIAEASTVNGSIRVAMGRADWTGTMKFSTVNGGITVDVPADLSAEIDAATVNGGIETDFPITVQGRFTSRRMHGTIGQGGRGLDLETVNGSIRLRKAS
jgi:hypothetical protein